MNIDDLKTGSAANQQQSMGTNNTIVDLNLQKNPPKRKAGHAPQKKVDPVKEFGLKSQDQLDRENPDLRVPEDKIYDDLDKMVEKENKKFEQFSDVYEQSEGQLTYEDYVDMHDGFDPISMMSNPPKPGHIVRLTEEQKRGMQQTAELKNYAPDTATYNAPEEETHSIASTTEKTESDGHNEISYQNDEVDEDAELEREIMEAIPEEDVESIPEEEIYEDTPTEEVANTKSSDIMDAPVDNSKILPDIPDTIESADRSEDADLKALDEDTSADSEDEISKQRLELLKQGVRSKIHPITKKFNISTMKMVERPVSVNNSLSRQRQSVGAVKTGDWVLPGSNRPVTMTRFKGSELEILVSDRSTRNRLNVIRDQYKLFYDHIVDPYKPADVDAWAKCTAVTDIDHLYACAYIASFEGINFLPYDCPNNKCNHSFVTDSVSFLDMVKFKDESSKNDMMKLLNQQPTKAGASFKTEIVPISDVFAFGLHMPSIYDVAFVNAMLDDDFITKYRDIIPVAPYVSGMYELELESSQIRPLYIKQYHDNIVKSTKAKIITLAKVLKELTSDQYNLLKAYTNEITGDDQQVITYKMPAVTCPKCKTEIPEAEYTASQLLFLRHHLASLANG